jgi:hypothetical protein
MLKMVTVLDTQGENRYRLLDDENDSRSARRGSADSLRSWLRRRERRERRSDNCP